MVFNHPSNIFFVACLLEACADCREFDMVLYARNSFLKKISCHLVLFGQIGLLPTSLSSCKTKVVELGADSDISIAGGEKTSEYNYVAKLVMDPLGQTNSEHEALCTGVFIDPTTVVTSAHCLQEKERSAAQPSIIFEKDGHEYTVDAKAVFGYSDLVGSKQIPVGLAGYDLALVQVGCSDEVCPQKGIGFPKIPSKSPVSDDKVTLVGYGAASLDQDKKEAGIKRAGANKVATVENNVIIVAAQESQLNKDQVIATYGDSGGPLLDSQGNLLGIGSSFTRENGQIKNYFSALSGSTWETLLKEYRYKTQQHSGGSKGYLFPIPEADKSAHVSGKKAESMFLLIPVVVGAALITKSKFVRVSAQNGTPTDVVVSTYKGSQPIKGSTNVSVNVPFASTQVSVPGTSTNINTGTAINVNTQVAQANVQSQQCFWHFFFLKCFN